jgi:hypothetical protein
MQWNDIKSRLKAGYQVMCNIMIGGLSGWTGSYPHWVLLNVLIK